MKCRHIISVIAFVGLMAVACASTPPESPYLLRAQQAYLDAKMDPTIARYAPVPLQEAAQNLEKARESEDAAERRHLAYLAEKNVELSRTLAAREAAEDQFGRLRAQQDEFLLQIRAKEAEQARKEAEEAQAQLRAYRSEQQQQELLQARSEIERLKDDIRGMEARQTEQGLLLTFGSVFFETDRAELKPGAQMSLRKLADFLQRHPGRQIVVEGHTDSRGSEDYNQQLSERRAQAVANVLKVEGIESNRITAMGMGENYPVAPNTTDAGRQQNRRVEVLIKNEGA